LDPDAERIFVGILKQKYQKITIDGDGYHKLTVSEFAKFNTSILELGDLSKDGKYFEALAAIFDLEGFTSFCNQIDPHLVIPEYLNSFLGWLFKELSDEFKHKQAGKHTSLWAQLPFFAKFLGDGVLFLWSTEELDQDDLGNVVISLRNICLKYNSSFLPAIRKTITKPPKRLRCGIARGQIISIGDQRDFVGPCINVASRLQKIGQFSFAFSKRGFRTEWFHKDFQNEFLLIKEAIRGVGDEELLYVNKAEFDLLPEKDKARLLP
jgi:hypothetical protein